MSTCHLSSCRTTSRRTSRFTLPLAVGLLILLCAALPASAETIISTLWTPIYPVPAGQSLYVTVADVLGSQEGGTLEIELIDDSGDTVAEFQGHLSNGRALTLGVDADDISFDGPFLQVRAVILIKKEDTSDLSTSLTIVRFDPDSLTTEPVCVRVGPSANDPGAEFNCPGTWEATHVIP